MTREETAKLIFAIKSTYPKTYEKFTEKDFAGMLDAWAFVFDEYSFEQIFLAFKAYATSNSSGFPPVPGQLISYTREQNPAKEMTSAEAWDLVYKGICRSGYNSEEEFAKLPELCQKAIGSAMNMKELALMDANIVMSVEGSNFKRNYEALMRRQREYEKIPEQTRARLEQINYGALIAAKS